jgi:hypothetical protein
VQDQNFGLMFTDSFLAQLDARLSGMREKLGKERDEIETRRVQAENRQRAMAKEFQDSFASGLPIGRRKRVNEARDRYLDQVQRNLRGRFDVRRREVAISALSAFATAVQEQRRRVQAMIDRLRRIEQQFRSTVERLIGEDRSHVLAQEIATKADFEQYYRDFKERGSVRPVIGLADQDGPFGRWLDLDQDTMASHTIKFTRNLFRPIEDISVESVFMERYSKEKEQIRKRLNDLIERSVPFWSYRKAGVLPSDWKLEEIVVVGVTERESSIYLNALGSDQQLTSTFDKHQLLVLQTKHGLPLFALDQYDQYLQAHDTVMQRISKPLYVLPEVRPGGHKAKQYFALGMIFGEIFVSGAFYYMQPENRVHQPIKLGQGMTNALQFLRSRNDLIRSLENRVNERVEEQGKSAAAAMVEAWTDAPFILERKGGVTNVNQEMTPNTTIGGPNYVAVDLVIDLRELMQKYNREVLKG